MRISGFLILLLLCPFTLAPAQDIVINELYNSGSTGEWVELLVLRDSLDVRGWSLRDYSSSGTAQNPLVFSSSAVWSALPAGTLIVIGDAGFGGPVDTDPSDRALAVMATDGTLFSGTVFAFAGSSDALALRNASAAHVFGISWGTNNASSLGSPKAHFPAALSSGTVAAFQGGSISELTNTASWVFSGSTSSQGAGNSTANLAWISSLRANADGSGIATIEPDTLRHGQMVTLRIGYRRDTAYAVTDLRVILPAAFAWSHTPADVVLTNVTGATTISGDTVTVSGTSFTGDSCSIELHGVIAPDSTAFYPILLQSKAALQFRTVAPELHVVLFGIPASIGSVKGNDANGIAVRNGQLVTVRGIVTVANQIGGPSYIQDHSGAIGIFGSAFSTAVQVGDEVTVSGRIEPFGGLTELVAPELHAIVSTGNTTAPMAVTCADIANDGSGGVENYEGVLVRINGVLVRDASGAALSTWANASSGTNYKLLDGTDTLDVRVDGDVDFANTPAPQGEFDIVGVVGQYKTTSPFIGGYQLLPRSSADILATGPGIAELPSESEITPSSFRISWKTTRPGTSALRAGTSSAYELGMVASDTANRTEHSIVVGGLSAAQIYHIQALSVSGVDTSWAGDLIVSTASAAPATGVINVYFNKSVMPSVVTTPPAAGDQDLVALLENRITSAHRSIDAALYSLSGTPGPGTDLANALIAARARGVSVRVICEADNRSTSPLNALPAAGIPIVTDAYDPVNAGAGLMHNKFVVIDGRGGAPESVWVWTGSWNPTVPGTSDDYQNAIEVQDPALAGAYLLEFNEMWGSGTDAPNAAASRFGARKTDNTPHRFRIGGRDVECYFSPSDRTTSRLVNTLASATHTINVALLTITRDDLANALLARKQAGVTIRGVVDDNTDSGSDYNALLAQGMDLHLKTGTGLLHHKYAVIDAGWAGAHPAVITGSHNWSSSAENANNENSLILHDAALADLYLQEFAARYYQFGGTGTIAVSVESDGNPAPTSFALLQNYPNPFNATTRIRYGVGVVSREGVVAARVRLAIYDVLGREVAILLDEQKAPGRYQVQFDGSQFSSGVYFYRLSAGNYVETKRMVLLK